MSAPRPRTTGDGPERARVRPWWIMRLSREKEKRLYFLATVASAAWYVMTRFL